MMHKLALAALVALPCEVVVLVKLLLRREYA